MKKKLAEKKKKAEKETKKEDTKGGGTHKTKAREILAQPRS